MQQHLKPNCDKNDVEITDLGGPVEGTGSTAASPSLANFMESFLTALRKFPGFWGSNRGFFFFFYVFGSYCRFLAQPKWNL